MDYPELADPALSRIQKILDATLADAREATAAITVPKCGAWYAARDEYIRGAVRGVDGDWARWDADKSAQLLLSIQQAMTELPPEAFKATCQRLIAQRIEAAARGNADTLERNGGLYDIENEVRR